MFSCSLLAKVQEQTQVVVIRDVFFSRSAHLLVCVEFNEKTRDSALNVRTPQQHLSGGRAGVVWIRECLYA